MLRGNELKDIFIDNEDRYRFPEILNYKAIDGKYSLYSYCLMDNHIHMLIMEADKPIKELIRRKGIKLEYLR
jgi:putative transposase